MNVMEADSTTEELGVIELNDGRVMMWMRTSLGCVYKDYSLVALSLV